MLYEPGRVFQLHENTCYSSVGNIGVLQTSPPLNHQFHYTVAGCSPKQTPGPTDAAEMTASSQAVVGYYTEHCHPQLRGQAVYVQLADQVAEFKRDPLPPQNSIVQTLQAVQQQELQQQQLHQPMDGIKQSPVHQQPQQNSAPSVLRVIVENMCYQITVDTLKQIFAKYGQVLKIVTFTKNSTFQALIQFADPVSAYNAKTALNGVNVYYGCCTLRIDFSKLSTLNVRYNNEKSRDFTDPTLSAGNVAVSPFSVSVVGYGSGSRAVGGQSLTPAVVASQSTPVLRTASQRRVWAPPPPARRPMSVLSHRQPSTFRGRSPSLTPSYSSQTFPSRQRPIIFLHYSGYTAM